MESSKKYNLEERLIDFSILILDVIEQLPNDKIGNHLGGQLLRSSPSRKSICRITRVGCNF